MVTWSSIMRTHKYVLKATVQNLVARATWRSGAPLGIWIPPSLNLLISCRCQSLCGILISTHSLNYQYELQGLTGYSVITHVWLVRWSLTGHSNVNQDRIPRPFTASGLQHSLGRQVAVVNRTAHSPSTVFKLFRMLRATYGWYRATQFQRV